MVHAVVAFPPWYYLTNPNGFLQRHDCWSKVDIWWINLRFLDLSTRVNRKDIVCPPFIYLYWWKDIVCPPFIHFWCRQNLWFIHILSTIHLVYPPFNHSIAQSSFIHLLTFIHYLSIPRFVKSDGSLRGGLTCVSLQLTPHLYQLRYRGSFFCLINQKLC